MAWVIGRLSVRLTVPFGVNVLWDPMATVASIDVGFPMRYSHSSLEVCDPADLEGLATLLEAAVGRIDGAFTLDRDAAT